RTFGVDHVDDVTLDHAAYLGFFGHQEPREEVMWESNALFHAGRAAQVRPIHVGAQFFAKDRSAGFAFDVDGETFSARLETAGDVSQVSEAGSAAESEVLSLFQRAKFGEVDAQVHPDVIHRAVYLRQHHSENLPLGVPVAQS